MNAILIAISLIVQLVPPILQKVGVITPGMQGLIQGLGSAVPALMTSIAAGNTSAGGFTLTMLTAFRAEILQLQQTPGIGAQELQDCATLLEAIEDAIAADHAATQTTEPGKLEPLPTDL